jgi:hypothetical protein
MTPGRGAAPVASSRFVACASTVNARLTEAALGGHYDVAGCAGPVEGRAVLLAPLPFEGTLQGRRG